jgi:RimJ/RimL family protein N-acetyltransferase
MNQPDIETERLILKPFVLADGPQVKKLAGNWDVSKTTLNIPFPYEDGMAEQWISTHSENWLKRKSAAFAIKHKKSHELIGDVSLVEIHENQAELGYWIGKPYWRMGYCTEAAKALVQYSMSEMGIVKIVAEHLRSNPASGRVMENIGMCHVLSTEKKDRDGNQAIIEIYEITST